LRGGADPGILPQRERWLALAAVLLLVGLAWVYLISLAQQMGASPGDPMPDMPGMDMGGGARLSPGFAPWTLSHAAFQFAMWAVMMVGMMTPSVTPMLLIYLRIAQQSAVAGVRFAAVGWFACGYLAAWLLFSALATAAQWTLEAAALLSPTMASSSRMLGGGVLLAAGLYQWLPLKAACLAQCRAPLSFVQRQGGFQPTAAGSLRLGLLHGLYCVGCCWALMTLLFVGGVMNLLWIAALMVLVLLEKLVPNGSVFSRTVGVVAAAAGIVMLAR
jgi:predicted metal-binding membrane protein